MMIGQDQRAQDGWQRGLAEAADQVEQPE